MKHNHIPDVMSEFDCQRISIHNAIKQLNLNYEFIECDDVHIMCECDTIEPFVDIYGY